MLKRFLESIYETVLQSDEKARSIVSNQLKLPQ